MINETIAKKLEEPGTTVLVVGPTRQYIRDVMAPQLPEPSEIRYTMGGVKCPDTFYYPNGSQVLFKSAEQGREKFAGYTADIAWIDEAEELDYRALQEIHFHSKIVID